jgi:hypothetical protein
MMHGESVRTLTFTLALVAICSLAGSAQAAFKAYSSSSENGTPGDGRGINANTCPPVTTSIGVLEGHVLLQDDGLGTVTLDEISDVQNQIVDPGVGPLVPVFGPGAFVYIDARLTRSVSAPHVSNTSGIGAHGPSSSAPGASVEWGIISGWEITGFLYCVASPVSICDQNGFAHGSTIPQQLPSTTYDLGTWNFDSEGDYESASWYVRRTSNGGLSNQQSRLRGAFHGAGLPALPLIGFAALALGLATVGGRTLRSSRDR